MAESIIVGAVREAMSKSNLITDVINKTWYFKSKLKDMKENIDRMSPIAAEMEKLNKALNRPDAEIKKFTSLLEKADNLVGNANISSSTCGRSIVMLRSWTI